MCGNRCRQEGFGGLHHDWVGSSKANRGGSAIRHERDGVGTTPGMAQRDGMHGGGDGEHRFLLETGIQRFGGTVKIILANPMHVKVLRGKKTDSKDSRWLAGLLRHGLVEGSFIPPRDIREQ